MAPLNETRQAVLAEIINVMAAAKARGEDEMAAARATFPGTPEPVLWSAWCELDNAAVEAWWETVERTIDAELVRKAITAGGASE
jgi:hypothetical protein